MLAPIRQSSAEVGSEATKVGPRSAKLGLKSANVGPRSANFGRGWPGIDQTRLEFDQRPDPEQLTGNVRASKSAAAPKKLSGWGTARLHHLWTNLKLWSGRRVFAVLSLGMMWEAALRLGTWRSTGGPPRSSAKTGLVRRDWLFYGYLTSTALECTGAAHTTLVTILVLHLFCADTTGAPHWKSPGAGLVIRWYLTGTALVLRCHYCADNLGPLSKVCRIFGSIRRTQIQLGPSSAEFGCYLAGSAEFAQMRSTPNRSWPIRAKFGRTRPMLLASGRRLLKCGPNAARAKPHRVRADIGRTRTHFG